MRWSSTGRTRRRRPPRCVAASDNAQAVEAQRRAIAGQQDERNRINARFDEEAARLQQLWQARADHAAGSAKR